MKFAFSVDLEDWYQGIELPYSSWSQYEHRVEKGLDKLLFLLSENNTKATFFTLGWIAEHHPEIIKKVHAEGHELASHGFTHEKVYDLSPDAFRQEVKETKDKIEALTGEVVKAYRAPFFSITTKSLWALEILAQENYTIDCSMSTVKTWRYGIADCPEKIFKIKGLELIEYPASTLSFLSKRFNVGGAYFRLLPYFLNRQNLNKKVKQEIHTMFYIHPWEYDPSHPVVAMEKKAKFTHYTNLNKTYPYTDKMLKEFEFDTVSNVIEVYKKTNTIDEVDISLFKA